MPSFNYMRSAAGHVACTPDRKHTTTSSDAHTTDITPPETPTRLAIPSPSRPMTIPSRNSSRSSSSSTATPPNHRRSHERRRKCDTPDSTHHQDALPAAVSALLAMTAIPARKSHRKSRPQFRRISIDELVQEWKSEALAMPSYGSHKSMGVLLESADAPADDGLATSTEDFGRSMRASRSTSSDSVPSLDMDDNTSMLSESNPCTPDGASLPANAYGTPLRKIKPRSMTPVEECCADHPLVAEQPPPEEDDDVSFVFTPSRPHIPRSKSSFTSNLTSSLQSLKTRALSSLSQLSLNNAGPNLSNTPYAYSDALLWQHPYIFPRLSPEIRPVEYSGTPESASRRYFNPSIDPAIKPVVLSFEEQQQHYRKALHSPSAIPPVDSRGMMIQLQTYTRKRASKAGNADNARVVAATSQPLVRLREPRENSDFLRVVVLELNMRRVGKLEERVSGRARIWLPPRQADKVAQEPIESMRAKGRANVPQRWRGVAADEI